MSAQGCVGRGPGEPRDYSCGLWRRDGVVTVSDLTPEEVHAELPDISLDAIRAAAYRWAQSWSCPRCGGLHYFCIGKDPEERR